MLNDAVPIAVPKKDFLDLLWDFFSSVKMAIWLLSISAVAILVGTVVEQNQPLEKYTATYGPILTRLMQWLNIFDLYHSWWFELLMALICVNLILSNFNRAEKIVRKFYVPSVQMNSAYFENADLNVSLTTSDTPEQAQSKIERALQKLNYKIRQEKSATAIHFYAHRGLFALWGSFIAHIGLLLLFVGVIYGHLPGQSFERNAILLEGDTLAIPESRFHVTLKKFEAKWDDLRRPLLYRSTLTVTDNNGKTFTKTVEVNKPLIHRGVKIYQATYGPGTIEGHYQDLNGKIKSFSVAYNENQMMFFPVNPGNGKQWVGVIRYFVPDFAVAPNGQVGSLSKEPVNPGCNIMLVTRTDKMPPDPKTIQQVGWITENHPASFGKMKFYLDRVALFSGFQLRKDPGVPFIYASFIIILLGVCLTFYIHHKVIRVQITSGKSGTEVVLVGARKDKEQDYAKEFTEITKTLPLLS